jgi:hypothetical protein
MAPPHVVDDQVRRRIVVEDETLAAKEQYERNYVPMDFTIKEIRDAIPAHLFVRDTTKSIMHVVKDLVTIAAVFYCATFIDTLPSLALRIPAWIAYWIIQGTVMVGPWILAHGKLQEILIVDKLDHSAQKREKRGGGGRQTLLIESVGQRNEELDKNGWQASTINP